jgi:hypothetical protein
MKRTVTNYKDLEVDSLTIQSLMDRAVKAYFRWCKKTGSIPDQPSNSSEVQEIDGEAHVILRNCNSVLAEYRLKTDGILKRVNA